MFNSDPDKSKQSAETKAAVAVATDVAEAKAEVVAAKAVTQTKTKAWLAGFGTLLLPLIIQNLLGTSDAAEMLFRFTMCHAVDIACPTGDDVYNAFKTLGGAIVSAVSVGYLTYFVPNRNKPAPTGE